MNAIPFSDRKTAGKHLANLLTAYKNDENCIAIGIMKGGIPVATQLAQLLNIKMDILGVKKLVMPSGYGDIMGAVTSHDESYINIDIQTFGSSYKRLVDRLCRFEHQRLKKMESHYRRNHSAAKLTGRDVILIDDGAQSGTSIIAAIETILKHSPNQIIVALPYASSSALDLIRRKADKVFCLQVVDGESHKVIYQRQDPLDDLSLKHLLWQVWDDTTQKKSPTLKSIKTKTPLWHTKPPEVIRKSEWRDFMQLFSNEHIGWLISIKVIRISDANKNPTNKPFHSVSYVKKAPLIGIQYTPNIDSIYIRYIQSERLKSWRIDAPKRTVFRNAGTDRKSIRIDNAAGETFYIQVLRESVEPEKKAHIQNKKLHLVH